MTTEQQRDALLPALVDAYRWLERLSQDKSCAAMTHYRQVLAECGFVVAPTCDDKPLKEGQSVHVTASYIELLEMDIPRDHAILMAGAYCTVKHNWTSTCEGGVAVNVPGVDDYWYVRREFIETIK